MIGVILVMHDRLGEVFLTVAQHVLGPQEKIKAISIGADDDMEKRRDEIGKAIKELDSGAGVVILTDMFGGTPSNLAISFLQEGKVEVLAGNNVPSLIKLLKSRSSENLNLAKLAEAALDAGKKYFIIASKTLDPD